MIKIKREYFRNSISKQSREEYFKKKRIVTCKLNLNSLAEEQFNELYERQMTPQEIGNKLNELYYEFNLFNERRLQILTQIRALSIKVVKIQNQQLINDFFLSIQANLFQQLLQFCQHEIANDPNTVELASNCLWILINLSLADECVSILMKSIDQIVELLKCKYGIIVELVLQLLFNFATEEKASFELLNSNNFEIAFLHRLQRQNPENIMNQSALLIKTLCVSLSDTKYIPKLIQFIFYCIRKDSMEGLIELFPQPTCYQFLKNYQGFCQQLFNQPLQSIRFINYLSTNNDDQVLDILLEYPVIDQLMVIRDKTSEVYVIFGNLATLEKSHSSLRIVLYEVYQTYQNKDLNWKKQISYFVTVFVIKCDPILYGDLLEHKIVDLLVNILQDLHDPGIVEDALIALQSLFTFNDGAKIRCKELGGFHIMNNLRQNDKIIQLVQNIN